MAAARRLLVMLLWSDGGRKYLVMQKRIIDGDSLLIYMYISSTHTPILYIGQDLDQGLFISVEGRVSGDVGDRGCT